MNNAPQHPLSRLLLLLILALCGASTAYAVPITYQLSGTFTGTLGTFAFDGPVTFLLNSDTAAAVDMGGYTVNTAGVSTVSVDGRLAYFTSPTFGVESEYFSAAFLDTSFDSFAVNTLNYDIAPDAIAGSFPTFYTGPYTSLLTGSAATTLGDLTLTASTGDTTFSLQTLATPEPPSWLLLCTGLIGVGLVRKYAAPAITSLGKVRC